MARLIYPLTESVLEKADLNAAIKVINSKLRSVKVPIIVDPIIKSTTGAILLKKNAYHEYKKMIIPLADVITPNRYEAISVNMFSSGNV